MHTFSVSKSFWGGRGEVPSVVADTLHGRAERLALEGESSGARQEYW